MISTAISPNFLVIKGVVPGVSGLGKFIYVDIDIDIGIVYDINID